MNRDLFRPLVAIIALFGLPCAVVVFLLWLT